MFHCKGKPDVGTLLSLQDQRPRGNEGPDVTGRKGGYHSIRQGWHLAPARASKKSTKPFKAQNRGGWEDSVVCREESVQAGQT